MMETRKETEKMENNQPIIKYSVSDAAIKELREKFGTFEPVNDNAGLKQIKASIKVVRDLRVGIEAKRKELKEDSLRWGRAVDAEAKRLTALLLEIETPMDDEKKRYEDKIAAAKAEADKIEAERVSKIKTSIERIKQIPLSMVSKSSAEIENFDLASVIDFDPQEFAEDYNLALSFARSELNRIHDAAESREMAEAKANEERQVMEAERAKMEAQRLVIEKENREREEKLKIERARMEAAERELRDERERIVREEQAKKNAEIAAEQARLAKEREAQEKKNTEIAAEQTRIAKEREEFEAQQREAEKKESERLSAIEQARIEEEKRQLELKNQETVTISKKEYEELLEDQRILRALEAAGVDNWDGYDVAMESLNE